MSANVNLFLSAEVAFARRTYVHHERPYQGICRLIARKILQRSLCRGQNRQISSVGSTYLWDLAGLNRRSLQHERHRVRHCLQALWQLGTMYHLGKISITCLVSAQMYSHRRQKGTKNLRSGLEAAFAKTSSVVIRSTEMGFSHITCLYR